MLCIINRTRVVLFDEPMVGLDPKAIKELKEIFIELKENGCSIIISTHMIDSIEGIWINPHYEERFGYCEQDP